MVTFDTLRLARRLREAGMPPEQAEAIADAEAEALGDFVLSNLATKGDIADLRGDIARVEGKVAEVRQEMADMRGELKGDIADLRGELGKIDARFEKMDKDFSLRFERMDRKFTIYFTVILFAVILLNQNALEFIARILGLVK